MSEVTVSQEYIDKAIIALNKSAFWEFADCPVTIRLAMRQAELDGRRANSAARSAAKIILKRVRDPMVRDYVAVGNDSNLLIVFYVQIMPDDFVMQFHRF